jgi:hypothetical protein
MQLTPPPYRPPGAPVADLPAADRRSAGTTPAQRATVLLIAAVSGVVAALTSSASPTGWGPADLVWIWLAAAVVSLCASRAQRWTLVWMALPAAALGVGAGRVAGIVALVAALVQLRAPRDRRVRAATGGLAAVGLLDLGLPGDLRLTGVTALVAVVAVAPAAWTAWRRARSNERRAAVWLLLGVSAVCVLGSVSAGVLAATTASSAERAVEASDAAVDEATDADPEATAARFRAAGEEFDTLDATANQPWFLPARVVPVVGNNVNLTRTAFAAGGELNRTAADLAVDADQSALSRPDGGVDLAVLASFAAPASDAAAAIGRARADLAAADSPWVLPPLGRRLEEISGSLEEAERSADVVADAAEVLPGMLGADGQRRYLLLLGNPAELRDIGGHLGNWAELVAVDGRLDLVEVGAPYDLFTPNDVVPPRIAGTYSDSFLEIRPQYFPQNWGSSPDMDAVARMAAELYPQARPGAPIDGVIYADPTAFAALLELTGGVQVPTTDVVLTSDNAVEFLTVDQFSVLTGLPAGVDPLADAIEEAVGRFSDAALPTPRRLVELFGDVVEGGHLQVSTFDPRANALLDRTGMRRTLERRDQEDLLAVVNRNANPSKIDAFLRREVTYAAEWQRSTGRIRSTVTVRLTNEAPADGLVDVQYQGPPTTPERTNRTQLSILSPLSAGGAQQDGSPTAFATQAETPSVFRHSVWVELAPGQSTEVTLELSGIVDAGEYRLRWIGQPMLVNEPTTVEVTDVEADPERADPFVSTFPAGENRTIRFGAGPEVG